MKRFRREIDSMICTIYTHDTSNIGGKKGEIIAFQCSKKTLKLEGGLCRKKDGVREFIKKKKKKDGVRERRIKHKLKKEKRNLTLFIFLK